MKNSSILSEKIFLYCSKKTVFNVPLNLLRDFISLVLMSTLFHSLGNITEGKLSIYSIIY